MPSWTRSLLHAAVFLVLLIVLAVAGKYLDIPPDQAGSLLGRYGHELLLDVGIAITLAVSLNLILGMTGQFSLGHAGFLAAGACTAALLAGRWFAPQLQFWMHSPLHLSIAGSFTAIMITGMICGAAVAAVLGLLVGLPTLRLRGDYLAIATLGFSEILVSIMQNLQVDNDFLLGGPTGLSLSNMRSEWVTNQPDTNAALATAVQNYMDEIPYTVGFFWVYAMALLTVYVVHNIKYATSGRSLLAIREDHIASESVGIPTTRYKVAAFVLGAALAGAAGGLLAHHKSAMGPESFRFLSSSFTGSITLVAMVILGGQGSITGSVLAAIILTVLPEALRSSTGWAYGHLHAWAGSPADPNANGLEHVGQIIKSLDIDKWRMVIYSISLILMMMFRPQGFLGRYEIRDAIVWLWRKRRGLPASHPSHARQPLQKETPSKSADAAPVLQLRGVGMSFGGLRAVDDFSLTLCPGELVGLIGPNGAGKTTAFNVLTGVYEPTRGEVIVNGTNTTFHWSFLKAVLFPVIGVPVALVGALWTSLTSCNVILDIVDRRHGDIGNDLMWLVPSVAILVFGLWMSRAIWSKKARYASMSSHAISRLGVARTFQNVRLFGRLSVLDNVMIAQYAHHRQGMPAAILRTPAFFREEARSRAVALDLLRIFHLDHLADECANSLPYGDQRRLEIARALATRPQLLLLDEPAAGMNPTEKRQLMDLIQWIRQQFGLTILLIEHDMKVVMGVCERIVVLDYGRIIAQGPPGEIRKNPAVIVAYLGASAKHG